MQDELKDYIKARGVLLCEVADEIGIAKSTFTWRLQKPVLTAAEIREIKKAARTVHEKKYRKE